MNNWDDIRFFLAVARAGSVRAAAIALGVNHTTVLRRMSHLEAHLGARLFEKLPSGYALTAAGAEILELAATMEDASSQLQTRVFARDQHLTGSLRISMPPPIATNLLMPDLAEFSQLHPEIELQILSSYETMNLTKRDADVAIRLVYDQMALPQHLIGTRLPDVHRGVYISRSLLNSVQSDALAALRWILKEEDGGIPEWASVSGVCTNLIPIKVSDLASQLAGASAGMGIAILPCFIGDADPMLARVPGSTTELYGTLWLLTLGETRKIKRIRLFGDFIKRRLIAHAELFGGKVPAESPYLL